MCISVCITYNISALPSRLSLSPHCQPVERHRGCVESCVNIFHNTVETSSESTLLRRVSPCFSNRCGSTPPTCYDGGYRDMLQPSDLTWEKKKRKIFQTLFFFLFVRGRIFYRWRGSWVKLRPNMEHQHRGDLDVTWQGTMGCLVLCCTV